jgi:hypothetical protein
MAASAGDEMTATWCLAGIRLRKLFVGLDMVIALCDVPAREKILLEVIEAEGDVDCF